MKLLRICLIYFVLPAALLAQTAATTNLLNQLNKEAQAATDPETKSLASDFGGKAAELSKSLGNNPEAQKQLESALAAVLGNKGPAAVDGLHKLSRAKLTPDQMRMSKEVYNLGSAYLVKKNFGSLEGSQGEVGQLVGALRKGSAKEAVPPLKKLGQNADLTPPQKDLLSSVMDSYAPGLKRVGEGLKGVPGLKN